MASLRDLFQAPWFPALQHALPGSAAGPFLARMGQGLIDMAAYPGQVAQQGYAGNVPSPQQMVPGATDIALSMIGGGTPFARAGTLGTSGGGIKAYHGSPHDFERFSSERI